MRLYVLLGLAVLGLDQLTKYWIMATMNLYEVQAIIPGLFNLVYVTNKGAAFSMLASIDSPIRHYFFISINSLAAIGLTIAAYRMRNHQVFYLISFALIASGALGNLIDRIRFGAVIDFLDFYVGSYHWPAFNVADSSICVGVAILFVMNILEIKKEKER